MAFKLPRLEAGYRIINEDGTPTSTFIQWWQTNAEAIEDAINGIQLALEAAGIALDAADVAIAAAEAAQTAADNAQGAADQSASESSLVNSYPANFTPPLISVDDLGNVTIANHDRVYGDSTLNPTVSVNGDTFATGAAAGSVVRIYYDDPTRAGGVVTFQFTVDPAAPPVQGGDRHSVGAVTVPATGSNDGNSLKPPGYVEP